MCWLKFSGPDCKEIAGQSGGWQDYARGSLPSLIGQSEIKGMSSNDPWAEERRTSAGSNFPLSQANEGIEKNSNNEHLKVFAIFFKRSKVFKAFVNLGQVRLGQVRLGKVRFCQVRFCQVRFLNIFLREFRSGYFLLDKHKHKLETRIFLTRQFLISIYHKLEN